ncbi:MAG: glycogen synthase GlgA [Limisphaerales bacterium]
MRILQASSEIVPFSKTGGLADMVAALTKFLARAGHTVGLVTPLYRGIRQKHPGLKPFDWRLHVPLGGRMITGSVYTLDPVPGLTIYFIDQPEFFNREGIYVDADRLEYVDNADRYIFFSKAVANLARHLPWRPELVHVHDWHTGLVPLLIRHQQWHDRWMQSPRTVMTIHNLLYQGQTGPAKYGLTNLPWYYFNTEGAEFYGQFNLLKAGINFADAVTTVSPRYAREITTREFGAGLDGVLRARQGVLSGILNGVDYEEWRTVGNAHLPRAYDVDDLAGKTANKLALQREMGLPVGAGTALFGTITRLENEKGVELVLAALEEMLAHELQYVLLGSGQPRYQDAFRALASRYPGKVAVRIGYDTRLAHRIEAACDFYLMPSLSEPCGLNQLYSLRYGAVPIVRATGGLDDAVTDARDDADLADGIKFKEKMPAALVKALRKALVLYGDPEAYRHYQENGMRKDFSWERTVAEYEAYYRRLLEGDPGPGRGTSTAAEAVRLPIAGR